MKFTALPVHDLTDVTLDLEQLQTRNILDQSSATVMKLTGIANTKGVMTWGSTTLSFAASTNSSGGAVTHGLGSTPSVVIASSFAAPGFGNIPTCNTLSYTSTTFNINGEVKTAFTGTVTVVWIAIG